MNLYIWVNIINTQFYWAHAQNLAQESYKPTSSIGNIHYQFSKLLSSFTKDCFNYQSFFEIYTSHFWDIIEISSDFESVKWSTCHPVRLSVKLPIHLSICWYIIILFSNLNYLGLTFIISISISLRKYFSRTPSKFGSIFRWILPASCQWSQWSSTRQFQSRLSITKPMGSTATTH